ncbi:MAG: hypothetical protein ABFD18_06190 [Syntrophomonas sp.]
MVNQPIHDPPDYSPELRVLTPSDRGHSDTFNPLYERLINNDAFLKSLTDLLMVHVHDGSGGGPPQIGTTGIQDGAVTPRKLTLGGNFEIWYSPQNNSVDFEAPVNGIPFVHTDTAFTGGLLTNMEIV